MFLQDTEYNVDHDISWWEIGHDNVKGQRLDWKR